VYPLRHLPSEFWDLDIPSRRFVFAMRLEPVFPCTGSGACGACSLLTALHPFFVKAVRNHVDICPCPHSFGDSLGSRVSRCNVHRRRSCAERLRRRPAEPAVTHVTVAGSVGTGTHGSGIQQGMQAMVSSFVLEITFVTHDARCARTLHLSVAPSSHSIQPQPRDVQL
jgi:hypothetical protein